MRGTSVKPTPSSAATASNNSNQPQAFIATSQTRRKRLFSRLKKPIEGVDSQLVLRGAVSVERLLALRDYTERTSWIRAVAVSLLTPVPELFLTLAIECISLTTPSHKLDQQQAFWLRIFVTSTVVVLFLGCSIREVAGRNVRLNMLRLLPAALLAATLYSVCLIAVAAVWTFPAPFMAVLGGGPFVICIVVAMVTVMDARTMVVETVKFKRRTAGINSVSSGLSLIYWVYPLHCVTFRFVGKSYQLPMLLILPLLKFGWKKRMCPKLTELEDFTPTIMMFTIELFNALYLATCMQSSGSPTTTVAILFVDFAQELNRIRRLHSRAADLLRSLQGNIGGSTPNLFQHFIQRIDRSQQRSRILQGVRIRGNGLDWQLSLPTKRMIQTLMDQQKQARKFTLSPTPGRFAPVRTEDNLVIHQTLQLLFQCEFMLLGEYFECAIPILYMIYLPILKTMKNCMYYGHIWSLSHTDLINALLSIGVYSCSSPCH